MGFHGFSFGSLILILLLALLLFGTKRIRNIGEDLGAALKSFRKGLQSEEETETPVLKNTEDPHPQPFSRVQEKGVNEEIKKDHV